MQARRVITSLTVLLTLAGHGLTQGPLQLPAMASDLSAVHVEPAPGKAVIVNSESQPPQSPASVEQIPPAPASNVTAAPANNNAAYQEKPCLDVTHSGPPDQMWFNAGYLLWQVDDLPLPAVLVAQGGTFNPQNNPLFASGATSIIGGDAGGVSYDLASGVHLEAGTWFGCQHVFGVSFGGFVLQQKTNTTAATSNGSTLITRPITNASTNQPFPDQPISIIVAGNGISGDVTVESSIQLSGAEINLHRNLWYSECSSFDFLMGFRYIGLDESLNISQFSVQTVGTPNLPFLGNTINTGLNRTTATDSFSTRNQLWGGQIGGRYEMRRGIVFGAMTGKVALGPNLQSFTIAGNSTASGVVPPATAAGGVLALQGTNITSDNTRWFTIAPQVGVQVGVQLTCNIRAYVGYDFLYMNNVVRPGDLINTRVNQGFVPTSALFNNTSGQREPTIRTSRDDFAAHGVELGMQVKY